MVRRGASGGGSPGGGEDGAAAEPAAAAPPPFRGYNPIRYTPCPDEFFDQQLAAMDADELRVTLYAFRRTFGFKKTGDAISISQFLHGIVTRDGRRLDHGCGLKTPRQVLAGLAKAERRRTLLSAFVCRACGGQVPDEAMVDEARRQRLVNGEQRRYTVRVVPRLCPSCGARLRGFEEKRYLLNVLDEAGAGSTLLPPSVGATDPLPVAAPSVAATDPLYPAGSAPSAGETDTRDREQHTARRDGLDGGPAPGGVRESTDRDDVTGTPAFRPPGSRLPSPQLWATALAQAAPALDPADLTGWLRAATLLAAEERGPEAAGWEPRAGERRSGGAEERRSEGAGPGVLTVVVGVPTEHARRRCAARAAAALATALATLLNRPVAVEPVVTGAWLAGNGR